MRATTLLLTAAFTLCGTAAFAQSSYNIVVEPVGQSIDSIINAPVEYDENGVVKAQHFNADDLTEEEYQALLDEADRIRAYRDANGLNFEDEYVYPETQATTVVERAPSYQVELFAPQTSTAPSSTVTTSALKTHTVSKGDTLYNISKRYDTTVQSIQTENGLAGTTLSIGQRIRIPGVIVESINMVSQPIFASAPIQDGYVTRRIVQPAPVIEQVQIESIAASEAVYAVLPKDTLYSISRRTCVGVKDIIAKNDIANPNALTPGQRITLPVGHCLTR
ncbi:MAG: LysM peptidoglycan-binding domain-containing protein [Litorimonas sp.]